MRAELPLHFLTGLDGQKSHITVNGIINGKEARLIIDSGASNSVLDVSLADHFGLVPDHAYQKESAVGLGSDSIDSSLSRAAVFELGAFRIMRFPFVLLDLSIINNTFRKTGSGHIDGIIGTDLLLAGHACIDYKRATITFSGSSRALQKFFRHPFAKESCD
jgi:hypothetical protein